MHIRKLVLAALLGGTMGPISDESGWGQESGGAVRPPVCAGTWYPGTSQELAEFVDGLLAKVTPPRVEGKPLALICPHAGYRYSAPVAAAAYASLRGHSYRRVIVLAFSHRYAGRYRGIDVPRDLTAYETPLGQVRIDRATCDRLLRDPLFVSKPEAGADEHSLELQLPFLQRVVGDFLLVPLLVGQMSDRDYTAAAQALLPVVDEQTLLVASTDCTHYGPGYGYVPFRTDVPSRLQELADQAARPLSRCDYDGLVAHLERTGDTICGRNPVCLLLRLLAMKGGAIGVRAAFDTSGRMTGDWVNSVTYQSFVYVPRPGRLNAAERAELLRIARQTVAAYLKGQKPPQVEAAKLPEALRQDGACFVTLQNRGELRGCIGNMVAEGPLYQAVIRNAISACRDPRFVNNPVTERELDELDIEISYLSPMKRVQSVDEIVIGQHGLLISLGPARGVLLPQVAYERGWTREEFLRQVCLKAALPPDAWKDSRAELYTFEAEVFGERRHPE
jgi:AmmeMemoRadiSam system protein B/AmmeMemoRadiSam system protein A